MKFNPNPVLGMVTLSLLGSACGGPSSASKTSCSIASECYAKNYTCDDDPEHCLIYEKYEDEECDFEMRFEEDIAAHEGCTAELKSFLECYNKNAYCYYEESYDLHTIGGTELCEEKAEQYEYCRERHANTEHNSYNYNFDTGW